MLPGGVFMVCAQCLLYLTIFRAGELELAAQWCKFLIVVTNTVVALLRNKGENVPLELFFFPCFSFSLAPLGMFGLFS